MNDNRTKDQRIADLSLCLEECRTEANHVVSDPRVRAIVIRDIENAMVWLQAPAFNPLT